MHNEIARKPPGINFGKMVLGLYIVFAVIVFLTGAEPVIRGPLADLVQQKPWIHRAALLIITLSAFLGLIWLLENSACNQKTIIPPVRALPLCGIPAVVWTWIIFMLFFIVMAISSCLRHAVFHSSFDMAIFVQAVWNTLHGDFLYSSIKGGICLLADHFSPILVLLILPYAIWQDPMNLLCIQALAVASCVFPIFMIAKERTRSDGFALVFVIAFALYLPVRNAVRFDFHPELLAMPVLLWAFYYLRRGYVLGSSLFLLLALTAKENVALVTFIIGLYAFLFVPRKKIYGIFWMIFSTLYFYTVIYVLIPHFLKQQYFYLDANFMAWRNYGWCALLRYLIDPSSFIYLVKIFAPVGFLSFLNIPALILTFPMLAQNLIARNEMARSIFFQYTALLTPFVFISAIDGAARLCSTRRAAYWLLFFSLAMTGISEYYVICMHWNKWRPEFRQYQTMMAQIPPAGSVRTHEFYAPHLAQRKEIHIYENDNPLEGGAEKARNADYVVLNRSLLGDRPDEDFNKLLASGYQEIEDYEGLKIFKKQTGSI